MPIAPLKRLSPAGHVQLHPARTERRPSRGSRFRKCAHTRAWRQLDRPRHSLACSRVNHHCLSIRYAHTLTT
jgi:hypothetical protein